MADEAEVTEETVEESEEAEVVEETEEVAAEEETAESGEEDGEATEETEAEPEAPVEPETVVLKVNGQDIEVSRDKLVELAQKGIGSEQKFNDAATQRQQLADVINDLKDPSRVLPLLEKMGHNTRKMAEDLLIKQMEEEAMTAEQRELFDAKKRIKSMEDAQNAQTKEKSNQDALVKQAQLREEYDTTFAKAFEDVDIPKTEESIAKMAFYMEAALDQGQEINHHKLPY